MQTITDKVKFMITISIYVYRRSCVMSSCSYYFAIDTTAMLVNRNTLRLLVEQNRTLLAPLVAIPKKLFSNFWGSLLSTGYYARSPDYIDIITRRKV